MKPVIVFLCVAVYCAHVDSYPGVRVVDRPNDDGENDDGAEVYIVPVDRRRATPQFPFGDSDEFGSIGPVVHEREYGLTPFFNPFFQRNNDLDGFLSSMQAMLLKMRQEMDEMMHRLPPIPDANPDTRIDVNDDSPLQNKSTSTTKVVDGHVVTVNESTFVNGDKDMNAVFRIKIIEVKPTEDSSTDKVPVPAEDSTENAERSPQDIDVKFGIDNSNDETNEIPTEKVRFSEWNSAETFSEPHPSLNEIDVDNSVEVFEKPHAEKVIDLSRDILVNKYISDQQEKQGLVMIDPDAELINFDNKKSGAYYHYNPQVESFQRLEEQKPADKDGVF